ncbi:MAG: DNA translocase FtsK [Oscillospiraceae bacterium]|nr:DNA translocase FtsK [Oscillospiraceae bacterium]
MPKKRKKKTSARKKQNTARVKKAENKSTARQNKEREIEQKAQKAERSRRLVEHSSALFFGLGSLLLAAAIIPGQSAWLWFHHAYRGVFGIGVYIVAALCVAEAVAFSFESVKKRGGAFVKYGFAALAVFLTAWHVFAFAYSSEYLQYTSWFDQIINEFYAARIHLSGGALGALLGAPLGKMGQTPALIILGVSFVTLLLFWTRQNIVSVAKGVGIAAKKITPRRKKSADKHRKKSEPFGEEQAEAALNEEFQERSKSSIARIFEGSANTKKNPPPAPKKHPKDPFGIFTQQKSQDESTAKKTVKKTAQTSAPSSPVPVIEDAAYCCPPLSILKNTAGGGANARAEELERNTARTLIETLESFGVRATIDNISRGPSVTRYELVPEAGVRINKITNLSDDIALRLAAVGVRIEAPIPGKSAIGIEVPNKIKAAVGLREILDSPVYKRSRSKLNVALGRDISGNVVCADLAKMPHLLIAGTTGSGKSVCMNTMIVSLLFNAAPDEVRMLMIDPKQVEFAIYNGVPHLEIPVVNDPRKAAAALTWAVGEMEKRYKLLAERGARDLSSYNEISARTGDFEMMTRIVIFIDELADLMMIAQKEVEDSICRIAQKARAAGIHLVIATQRPSVDVITGLIKANVPSRIALSVSSQVDSRTILDAAGAEKLLGYGDMLFAPVDLQKPVRVQGCYISDAEVEQVVQFVSRQCNTEYDDSIQNEIESLAADIGKSKKGASFGDELVSTAGGSGERDDMFEEAIRVVVDAQMASTTLLQRRLKLGYARASRVIEELEQAGIVGPFEGSRPRKVLISKVQYHERTALGGSFIPGAQEAPPWED